MAKMRTRARTVDMLGRQQIATVQNAIVELFKNAYDANATRVQADYLCGHGGQGSDLLCIRDDGYGMTKEDFINKWLVIGTDNKANYKTNSPGEHRVEGRVITGEKGIGRLAIALLGRQVVIATRAIRQDGLKQLVVAWVHWGLFEIPGVDLEDIDIPVETFDGGYIPDNVDMGVMKSDLLDNVKEGSAAWDQDSEACEKIRQEIEGFNPGFRDEDEFLRQLTDGNGLTLSGNGHGTFFQIGNVNENIVYEIRGEKENSDNRFSKLLLGFGDRVFTERPIAFETSFKFWLRGSVVGEELLDSSSFMSRDEVVKDMDHYVEGFIDATGAFCGRVRRFDKWFDDVRIETQQSIEKREFGCGPFKLVFGCLQRKSVESKLAQVDPERYRQISDKLERIGGMYVYRDGVRILPYGDADVDWLEIDKRRTLRAGQYFFSNRNMFGAVLLSSSANQGLQEKAGREGLQKNLAYRQMRDALIAILKRLAVDYFVNSDEKDAEDSAKIAAALKAEEVRVNQRIERAKRRLGSFSRKLEKFFESYNKQEIRREIDDVVSSVVAKIAKLELGPTVECAELLALEEDGHRRVIEISNRNNLRKPVDCALPADLLELWSSYEKAIQTLKSDCFQGALCEISSAIDGVAARRGLVLDEAARTESFLKGEFERIDKDVVAISHDVSILAKDLTHSLESAMLGLSHQKSELVREFDDEMLKARQAAGRGDHECSCCNVERWFERIEEFRKQNIGRAESLRSSLGEFSKAVTGAGENFAETMSLLEKRIIDLQDQSAQDFVLVQLGMAIGVISHEFTATLRRIHLSMRSLQEFSKRAGVLKPLTNQLFSDFAHLGNYLRLFTPLQKSLAIERVDITGAEMQGYIESVFVPRFAKEHIILRVAVSFDRCKVHCYTSTIYPALINIVDNACYWLSRSAGKRILHIGLCEDGVVIANSGEPIRFEDRDRIFSSGFTRKPGGRGLGMFIARKALEGEGFSLELTDSHPADCKVAFLIRIPGFRKEGV